MKSSNTRRNFLRTSAIVGTGLGAIEGTLGLADIAQFTAPATPKG